LTRIHALAAELAGREGHHVGDLGGLAHVGAVVGDLDTQGRHGLLGALDIAEAVEHDVGALPGQCLGNAQSDPAGRSRDESCLSFEHGGLSPLALEGEVRRFMITGS